MMPTQGGVPCVAASTNGKWIAAGTAFGLLFVWDATTNWQPVITNQAGAPVNNIDFSPDSTRLVFALNNGTIAIREIARPIARTFNVSGRVFAAKYSPQGDRVAITTDESVQVWDSNNGQLLVNVNVQVRACRSLPWCKNHLLVLTRDGKIKQINAANGSIVSEWSVLPSAQWPCIALPQHGRFLACSANSNKRVVFWDTTKHSQLRTIHLSSDIFSFTFSSDDSLLAIVIVGSKIVIRTLFQSVSVRFMSFNLHPIPTSHSRTLNLISTRLHSMHGSAANLQTQKHYYLMQSHRRISIMYLLVEL